MRAADLVVAALLIALGALVIWDSVRLGIGWGLDGPGSGFFPFWLATAMVASCVAIIVQTLRRKETKPFVRREALASVLKVLVPATGLVVLTEFVGLYVASALYVAFNMRWLGRHSWLAVALVGVGFPVIAFLIFETWFLVPMPKGPVERWLGY